MSNIKKAAQNSLFLSISSIFNRVFDLISIFLLVSYLSIDDFGRFTSIFAYVSLCAIFIDFGMGSILIRECARNDKTALELMRSGFLVGLVMSFFVIIASYITLDLLDYPEEIKNLFWYAIFAVLVSSRFKSFRKIFEVMFIANFKVGWISIFNVLSRILFIVFIYLIVRLSNSVSHAVLLAVVVDVLGTFLLVILYTKNFEFPKLSWNWPRIKYLISESWPLLLSSSANIINLRIDIIIITGMVTKGILTESDIGLYRFGTFIPEALSFLPFAITTPLFPILSKKFTVDKQAFLNVYKLTVKYLMFIALPIIMYLFIEIDEIMQLLVNNSLLSLNEDYLQSIPVIRILLFSEVFVFGYVAFGTVLITSDNQRLNLVITLISAGSNIVLNYLLIAPYGIRGAAYATLVSYGLFMITALFIPRIRVYSWELLLSMLKPCIAAATMGGFIYIIGLNMWLSLISGMVIYVAVFIALRGFEKRDFEIIEEIYPNKIANWLQRILF